MFRIITLIIAVCLPMTAIDAGEYNPVLSVGDVVQPWENLPSTDGEPHSWKDLKDKKAIVIAFTCNTCPYAVDYQERLKSLANKWQANDQVAVIAVNSNLIDDDSLDAMKERAKSEELSFPYLKDEKQELGKAWGATRTPEFFVINQERKVVYMGALDDDTNPDEATVNYVNQAVEAVLAGKKPEVQETVAIGCNIRYKRSRR